MRSTCAFLLLLLLSSCNIGDWATPEPKPLYPEKTSNGQDILVCMVNKDMNLEVYYEDRDLLFDEKEIRAAYDPSSTNKIWLSAKRKNEFNTETEIQLAVKEAAPKLNATYNITAKYTGWRGIYVGDESRSIIRFSRIDSLVVAGEFVFTGIDEHNDTISFQGYFDIPFRD